MRIFSGRINCNEYVKNIIDNHNFVLSGNTVIANLENVIKSIPNENHLYLVSFMSGYSLITSKNNMVMYTTDSIDVSNAVLNKKEIPVNKKSGNGKNKNKKRTGKRDYTVSVHMKRLREKLGTYKGMDYIETVRGIGYRWRSI